MIRVLTTALAALLLAAAGAPAQAADARRLVIVDQDMFGPGGSNMNSEIGRAHV